MLSPVWFFAALQTKAHQAPLSMEFSRHKYWSRLLFSPQGIFPTQELNPHLSCLLHCPVGFSFTTELLRKPTQSKGEAEARVGWDMNQREWAGNKVRKPQGILAEASGAASTVAIDWWAVDTDSEPAAREESGKMFASGLKTILRSNRGTGQYCWSKGWEKLPWGDAVYTNLWKLGWLLLDGRRGRKGHLMQRIQQAHRLGGVWVPGHMGCSGGQVFWHF